MIYLIIYLSIGFGVWLGLASLRVTQGNYKGDSWLSYVLGFVGGVGFWPLLIFHLEP